MPIQSRKNLYRGINAHLNSILQNTYAGWEEFHGLHTVDIARFIDSQLPPRYAASYERSYQITALTAEKRDQVIRSARPDTTIYQISPSVVVSTGTATASTPTLTLPASQVFEHPEDYLRAVSIRAFDDDDHKVVAWIELLSPSNKPPASGFGEYHAKRLAALHAGIVFVEIDYLQQYRPVIDELAPYPEKRAFPYYIALTDPRPVFHESIVEIYGFAVDEVIPNVPIPLLDGDSVTVNFNDIYDYSFQSFRRFADQVDYEHEPPQFDHYSPSDQERIRSVMTKAQVQS